MGARKGVGIDLKFSKDERALLKKVATDSIESALFERPEGALEVPERLKEKMGAFVCLKTRGELKGCIGYIKGVLPLHQTIREMARQAAFHDPRFMPLSPAEWKHTDIEISVLTPFIKVRDVEGIEVGKHGLYIEKGGHSGLLLPQVAIEQGWNRDEFLEFTCMKAGLPRDAWKDADATIYIFSADVF